MQIDNLEDIPEWYRYVIQNDNEVIDWVAADKFHYGYCKFCEEELYNDKIGDIITEYKHMMSDHTAELSIYRLRSL